MSTATTLTRAALTSRTSMSWYLRPAHPLLAKSAALADALTVAGPQGLFKVVELARLAADTGISITVCHFPPGTSKFNKIEHRLWSQVTSNWRGQPLEAGDASVARWCACGQEELGELCSSCHLVGSLRVSRGSDDDAVDGSDD